VATDSLTGSVDYGGDFLERNLAYKCNGHGIVESRRDKAVSVLEREQEDGLLVFQEIEMCSTKKSNIMWLAVSMTSGCTFAN
jgi:hypothetical protein